MITKRLLKIVLLNLAVPLFGCQQHDTIDDYLSAEHKKGKLNGNVLVIKNGEKHYEKTFGYTDGSKNTMLTKDYRFNIGSIYKEFPAISIMQLFEKGELKLEDKVSKYITFLPSWSEKVSIKNLLQYSSGLPMIDWNSYFSEGITITDRHILEEIKSVKNLEFDPGSDYLYSNSNPILLIKIVESITQITFNDYLKKNIFVPYGMDGTVIKEQYPYTDKTLMAIPFNSDFKEDDYSLSVQSLLFSSTTDDMANWFEQLGDFKIISKESVKKLSRKAMAGDNIQ